MNNQLRILLSVHHKLDINAGAPGATYQLASQYRHLGHKVSLVAFDNLPGWMPERLQMLSFPLYLAWHIKVTLRKKKLDIVDASSGDAWLYSLLKNRKKRPLLVMRSHGLEHTYYENELVEARNASRPVSRRFHLYHGGLRLWEVNGTLHRSDLSLLLNEDNRELAVETIKVPAGQLRLVSNGIPSYFLNLPFFETPAGADTPLNLAFVGSYLGRKGIKYLAPALSAILEKYPRLAVTFLGTGATEATVKKDYPAALADRIRVVPRFDHKELPSYLKDCQILLFPSLYEGFSMALVEAMACGLAPVATSISGNKEIIEDDLNGLLVPTGDSPAFQQALERLIEDRPLLDRLRRAAYQKAQNYSWEKVAERNLALYSEFLAGKAG